MARRKTPPAPVHVSEAVARRLRELREELFGKDGGPELARRLGLPARTWYLYESGVTVPAEVLLGFIEQTGTNPVYLFTGEGSHISRPRVDRPISDLTPEELIRQGLERLEASGARGRNQAARRSTGGVCSFAHLPARSPALGRASKLGQYA